MRYLLLPALLLAFPAQAQDALSGIAINEILADPNSTTNNFDTDGDGEFETDDEFVEFFNASGTAVDISGWQVYDNTDLAHTFDPNTVLAPGDFVAVVGAYDPGTPPPGSNIVAANESTLGLGNGGDTVFLYDPGTDRYIAASYNGNTSAFPGPASAAESARTDFGSDTDGLSIQRQPDGSDTFVVQTPTPGATNGDGGGGGPAFISVAFSDQSTIAFENQGDVEIGVTLTTAGAVDTDREIAVVVEQVSGDADDADFADRGPRTLVFPAGTSSGAQLFATYTLIDDAQEEQTEIADLGLSAASSGTAPDDFGTTSTSLVILDNDGTGVEPGRIVITEIMYDPNSTENDPNGNNVEWIEIANTVDEPVDLAGFTIQDFGDGVADFVGGVLGGFEIGVVVSDDITDEEFQAAWGTGFPIFKLDFDRIEGLSNNPGEQNEVLTLRDGQLTVIDVVNFDNDSPWPSNNNSASIYLDLTDEQIVANGAALNDDGSNWALSTLDGGARNPGSRPNTVTPIFDGNDVGSPGLVNNDSQVPVELAQPLQARLESGRVLLTWSTASETNNAYFEVLARSAADAEFASIGQVEGAGTTSAAQQYTFGADLAPGIYRFRLRQVDLDGTAEVVSETEASVALDGTHQVTAVAPNPSAGAAHLTVSAARAQRVTVRVYDALGRLVATALNADVEAQQARRVALGDGLAPGVYVAVVAGERFRETRRFTVSR